MKFNGTNQYLNVPNFNPTKELGYTCIVAFTSVVGTVQIFFEKRNGALAQALGAIIGYPTNQSLSTQFYTTSTVEQSNNWTSKNDLLKTNFIVAKIGAHETYASQIKFWAMQNQSVIVDSSLGAANTIYGFDEYTTPDLFIGGNPNVSGFLLNGTLSHLSIFKGYLTQPQILDIINNGLQGNAIASLMTNCQLYLNFEEILVNGTTYTIKDWSPQNRTVTLNNYSSNEVTPGDPLYRLIDLNTLR